MSLVSLFMKTKPRIGTIEFEASLSEDHGRDVTWTQNPITRGFRPTDHSVVEPDTLTIDGIVSSTPDLLLPLLRPGRDENYHKTIWRELLDMSESGELFDVFTSLAAYKDMAILSVRTRREAMTTNALIFTVTMKKMRIASSRFIENLASDVADAASGEADMGTQS